MAPFGPVLDMVAKLNSTKSFCWLKEKTVITTAQVSRAHQAPGAPGVPILNFTHLSLPLSLESHLGKHTWLEELYRSKPYRPNHVEICLLSLPFPYKQQVHHPDRPGKKCPKQFLVCYLFTQKHL